MHGSEREELALSLARTAHNEVVAQPRPAGFPALAAVPPAFQRMRRTGGLLLITGIRMIATVMLVCAVPLYAQVAMAAGLRGVLITNPEDADIGVTGTSPSSSSIFACLLREPRFTLYVGQKAK